MTTSPDDPTGQQLVEIDGLGGWGICPPIEGVVGRWHITDPDGGACALFDDDEEGAAMHAAAEEGAASIAAALQYATSRATAAEAIVASQQARIAELEEALKPADALSRNIVDDLTDGDGENIHPEWSDADIEYILKLARDFRRARAVFDQKGDADGK